MVAGYLEVGRFRGARAAPLVTSRNNSHLSGIRNGFRDSDWSPKLGVIAVWSVFLCATVGPKRNGALPRRSVSGPRGYEVQIYESA